MSDDAGAVVDIVQCCRYLVTTTAGVTFEQWVADQDKLFGVQHQLMVMGEAVKRLSDEFRAAHGQLRWREIAGMRDVLIHSYDEVDLPRVWKTVAVDVPAILVVLESIVPRE